MKIYYGVQSGDGYFEKFINGQHQMTSDPACAARLSLQEAQRISRVIENAGFETSLFKITHVELEQ